MAKLRISFFSNKKHLNGSKLREEALFVLGQRWSSFVNELPLMSTAAGSAGYPVGQSCDNDHGMINLDVRTLAGEEFGLRVERSTRGSEVLKMVLDHLPGRSGAKLVLDHVRHRNSNLVLYLCANPIAVCMVLLNGVRNP